MKFSTVTLSVVTVVLILALMGWGIRQRIQPSEGEAATEQTAEGEGATLPGAAGQQFSTEAAQAVAGATVVRDTLWITVTASGQAAAYRQATVAARVPGTITRLDVRENSPVRSDQALVMIDTTEYGLALQRASAELQNAEVSFREYILFDEELTDSLQRQERERFARSRSGLTQAEVGYREAELNMARTRVAAPFPGRVANLKVVAGEYVTQGQELLTVVDIDPIKVEVAVLEAELRHLREGHRAVARFAALPGESFEGRIESINPVVETEGRSARVTIHLPNPDGRIMPGMYARVSLDAEHYPDRILVPRTAVLERDRRTMLFVLEGGETEGIAAWRYVTTGRESDHLVEIVPHDDTFMVEPGETVLVDGHHYLSHGSSIRLTDEPAVLRSVR
jgi:membrane fusion protein, multidrug efflux system